MNIKYGATFLLLAGLIASGILLVGGGMEKALIVYIAFSFFATGLAYVFNMPRFWLKRASGRIHPISLLAFAPMHALNWLSLGLAIRLGNEPAFHEIMPGLWLGRRLLSKEAQFFVSNPAAVLDLTGEFSENKGLAAGIYLCLPTLDNTVPSEEQLEVAIAFIGQHIPLRPVFVHCALGHGRSATVVAAWLLRQNGTVDVEAVLGRIQAIRPGVRLNADQISILRKLFNR